MLLTLPHSGNRKLTFAGQKAMDTIAKVTLLFVVLVVVSLLTFVFVAERQVRQVKRTPLPPAVVNVRA